MQRRALVSLWVAAALLLPAAASAEKSYVADRIDSRIEILTGGTLRVSETLVFRFEGGQFTSVYRTIPTHRTDGVEIVAAEMDGRVFPRGREAGQVEIDGGQNVRVRWRFRPVSDATHVFGLTYVVRGAAWDDGGSDIFFWAPLPRRHAYPITRARVDVRHPPSASPLAPPQVSLVRARQPEIASRADGVEFTTGELPKDGYLEVRLAFPHGTLLAAMPGWQTREQRVRRMAPVWIAGALCAALVAFGALLRIRAQAPRRDQLAAGAPEITPPAPLPASLAGRLRRGGRTSWADALATIFDLARRGTLRIIEMPKAGPLRRRQVLVRRADPSAARAAPERVLLETIFSSGAEHEVALKKALHRVRAGWSRFTAAQNDDLRAAGLLDDERLRVRRSLHRWSTALLLVASSGALVPILLPDTFGGWPYLVPVAVIAIAIVGYGMAASFSTLTAEGQRQAGRWRGFAQHLKNVARGRADVRSNDDFETYLPYAAVFGIGPIWLAHFQKRRDLHAPTWLQTAIGDDGGMAALGAMFADGSAAGGGDGGGGAGGGAGGGGSSGAD